jgi:hypothetical protein
LPPARNPFREDERIPGKEQLIPQYPFVNIMCGLVEIDEIVWKEGYAL